MQCQNEHDKGHNIIEYRKVFEEEENIKKELL
jgi:hypothetical protein